MNKKCHREENTNDAKTVFKIDVTNELVSPDDCSNYLINIKNQRCEFNINKRDSDSGDRKYKEEEGSSNELTPIPEENCYSNENQNKGI